MKSWRAVLLIIFAIVCLNAVYLVSLQYRSGFVDRPTVTESSLPQCGHWAVVNGCKLKGIGIAVNDAMAVLPSNPDGHSFKQLKIAFEGFGVDAAFQKFDFSGIRSGQQSLVIHLKNPDHFVVCFLKTNHGLYCFDAAGKRSVLRDRDISSHWTGNVLVLDRIANSSSRQGPAIQFDTLYADKGDINDDIPEVEVEFPFENVGDQPLVITNVEASCLCLKTTYTKELILPGDTGVIHASFRNPQSDGFVENLTVHTNNARSPVVLTVQAGMVPWAKVFPVDLNFGKIVIGSSKTIELKVRVQHDGVELVDANSQSLQVKPKVEVKQTADKLTYGNTHSDFVVSVTLSADPSMNRQFRDHLILTALMV